MRVFFSFISNKTGKELKQHSGQLLPYLPCRACIFSPVLYSYPVCVNVLDSCSVRVRIDTRSCSFHGDLSQKFKFMRKVSNILVTYYVFIELLTCSAGETADSGLLYCV